MINRQNSLRNFQSFISILFLILCMAVCSRKNKVDLQMKRDHIIVDKLNRAENYFNMHPAFEQAFMFLRQNNLSQLATGRHEIDGDLIYCKVQKGPGRKRIDSRLEAHRKYIDIQYVIAGNDEMGWKPASKCKTIDVPYDENRDIAYFKDEPESWSQVSAGSFAIFFPEDAHAPLVSENEIHKVVIKVAVEWPQ